MPKQMTRAELLSELERFQGLYQTALAAPASKQQVREAIEEMTAPKVVERHQLGLNIQAPAFKASLTAMIEFCGSWFTSVQGFNRDNFDGDVMLVVTELAEAVEADRKKAKDDHIPEMEGRAVELADALVRILHIASKYQLPLADAFIAKQQFNLTRPPKHGKGY